MTEDSKVEVVGAGQVDGIVVSSIQGLPETMRDVVALSISFVNEDVLKVEADEGFSFLVDDSDFATMMTVRSSHEFPSPVAIIGVEDRNGRGSALFVDIPAVFGDEVSENILSDILDEDVFSAWKDGVEISEVVGTKRSASGVSTFILLSSLFSSNNDVRRAASRIYHPSEQRKRSTSLFGRSIDLDFAHSLTQDVFGTSDITAVNQDEAQRALSDLSTDYFGVNENDETLPLGFTGAVANAIMGGDNAARSVSSSMFPAIISQSINSIVMNENGEEFKILSVSIPLNVTGAMMGPALLTDVERNLRSDIISSIPTSTLMSADGDFPIFSMEIINHVTDVIVKDVELYRALTKPNSEVNEMVKSHVRNPLNGISSAEEVACFIFLLSSFSYWRSLMGSGVVPQGKTEIEDERIDFIASTVSDVVKLTLEALPTIVENGDGDSDEETPW